MKVYDDYNYRNVYTKKIKETREDEVENIRDSNKLRYTYMKKTIISGNVVESELYPVWKCRNDIPRLPIGESSESQRRLNDKNAKKKIVRLVNTNFNKDDLMVTLTYADNHLPKEDEAKRDIENYIRRLKRRRKKEGLPELKYLYVIEYVNDPSVSKKIRVHHHIIINKMDRDIAESVWKKGRTDSMRLQPDDFGLTGIAKYVAKGLLQGRRWSYSKNLKKPIITKNRTTLTKRRVEKIAKRPDEYQEFFESVYKGKYEYKDCETLYSDRANGFYLYARMKKRE
ncbi:hypothetical protein FDB30_03660 [Clostridium botulinum]|uniref:rolling circle replication-associated protein n=1 Tax=Clostridium botulinum TaxID=1491 RepID=UPI0007740A3D|nr:hypothetical protein [Clostridium botulinum]MBY7025187.1 hypothetical protein [Clostridium botulinum]NFE83362.1 hypothetical protein [Clostridium botulinum]NFG36780.1 hypothetical protein [Clostridium botulinum]NFN27422.1 hypothetical protein [Clostridium botulinum]NFN46407.1 hypothetical protein [Clostridium botulinum]